MTKEDLQRATKFFYHGKIEEAFQIVERMEMAGNLSANDFQTCQILRSQILVRKGRYQEGLELAKSLITESRKN